MPASDRLLWPLLSALILLSLGATARAEGSAAVVWYRASGECPAGAEFLERLGERAKLARLAHAGDHVDFVVTLQSADRETVGRVERQTASGTVAIRELRDPSCTHVADALALSLSLSLQPETSSERAIDPTVQPEAVPSPEPAAAASAALAAAPAPRENVATAAPAAAPTTALASVRSAGEQGAKSDGPLPIREATAEGGWLGLQLGGLTGVAPNVLARGAAVLGIENVLPNLVRGASLSFSPVFAYGRASTPVGSIERWLLAARAEGCPVRWGGRGFGVAPCVGAEVGVTHGSIADASVPGESSLWLAAGLGVRLALAIAAGTRLEAQAEAQAPLFRNDVVAGSDMLYRQRMIGFQGGLGVSARLW